MIKRQMQHKKSKPPCRISTGALKDQKMKEKLSKEMDKKLEHRDAENGYLEQKWKDLREKVFSTWQAGPKTPGLV